MIKTHSPSEKRHWVRTIAACNNRCLFCLDRDSLDGEILTLEEITADLKIGRKMGAERAIISGGEPTIHPQFIEILKIASEMGYTWVQTITNGRMFFYKSFLKKAVLAGLKEVTFSLHANKPELFNQITGINGSFEQSITGLKNALDFKELIVSVDIVLNALNIDILPDIVDFYVRLGVGEFDLLYPVPFGAAWKNRSMLFFEPHKLSPILDKILGKEKHRDVVFWTNRFPPPLLEGMEAFIQPPEKIYDEVFGRRQMFLDWLENGKEPLCRNRRCDYCNMRSFCNTIVELKKIVDSSKKISYIVTPETISSLENISPPSVNELVFDPPECALNPVLARFTQSDEILFTLIHRVISGNFDDYGLKLCEHEVMLNNQTTAFLLKNVLPKSSGGRNVHLASCCYNNQELSSDDEISLKEFFKKFQNIRFFNEKNIRNVPPCIGNGKKYIGTQRLPVDIFTKDRKWNLESVIKCFLQHYNLQKSYRCEECKHTSSCPGINVQYIKKFGFRELTPITE